MSPTRREILRESSATIAGVTIAAGYTAAGEQSADAAGQRNAETDLIVVNNRREAASVRVEVEPRQGRGAVAASRRRVDLAEREPVEVIDGSGPPTFPLADVPNAFTGTLDVRTGGEYFVRGVDNVGASDWMLVRLPEGGFPEYQRIHVGLFPVELERPTVEVAVEEGGEP